MTLLPSDEFGITGWPGNAYKVNDICAHPSCNRRSAHAHHMWRRSFIRKDYDWVRLPTGEILGNRVGLCQEHHDDVTGMVGGHRAWIRWDSGIMWWETREPRIDDVRGWIRVGPLTTQPPVATRIGVTQDSATGETLKTEAHGHVAGSDDELVCPTCGHHKRNPDAPHAKLERRHTKQWVVNVPDDAESGSDLLDSFVEDFAIPIGATDWSPRLKRYYVLVMALAWVAQNRTEFIADLAEAAERRTAA